MKAFVVDLDSSKNQIMLKSSVRSFNNQAHQINEAAEKIDELIDKLIQNAPYSNDNIVLKRNEIKEAFFSPLQERLNKTKIFLSHSHIDMKNNDFLGVKNIKSFLKPTDGSNLIFIDSLFWDYKNDILKEIKKHHIDVSKIKDAFTLILRESLEDMIKKCPYFVFLESKNSVSLNQDLLGITYSAWIYEELKIAHSISESRPIPMMESMQVFHDISPFLKSFETITLKKLSQQINS
ncbi:toll/interleukin-1 receptor domain-containing protein [Helicobacter pylori]